MPSALPYLKDHESDEQIVYRFISEAGYEASNDWNSGSIIESNSAPEYGVVNEVVKLRGVVNSGNYSVAIPNNGISLWFDKDENKIKIKVTNDEWQSILGGARYPFIELEYTKQAIVPG